MKERGERQRHRSTHQPLSAKWLTWWVSRRRGGILTKQYIPDPSGSRTLLVPHMGRISRVKITPTPQELYKRHLSLFPPLRVGEKLGVNKRFWSMLFAVLKVAFPRWVEVTLSGRAKLIGQQNRKGSFLAGSPHILPSHQNSAQRHGRPFGRAYRARSSGYHCANSLTIGIGQRQGVHPRSGLVVCSCPTEHLYQLHGES